MIESKVKGKCRCIRRSSNIYQPRRRRRGGEGGLGLYRVDGEVWEEGGAGACVSVCVCVCGGGRGRRGIILKPVGIYHICFN